MRMLPILLVASLAMAGGASMHDDYALAARQAQIQQTPSAEIHRQLASNAAAIERALEQPALPHMTPAGSSTTTPDPVRWSLQDASPRRPRYS